MKSDDGETRRRGYDNRLREAHARQTRERILDAVTGLLSEGLVGDVTITTIAERAGVSEPTIYRHFGSRERLYRELDRHMREQIGMPEFPSSGDALPDAAAELYRRFEANAEVLRAAYRAGFTREVREQSKLERHQEMRELLRPRTSHLEEEDARAIAAMFRLIVSWDAWARLTGEMGIDGEHAASAASWAIRALTEKLEADRAAAERAKDEGEEK